MCPSIRTILVTGGAGFIGSAFVKKALERGYRVVVVDKLTYAGDTRRLTAVMKKVRFYKADICDKQEMRRIAARERPSLVVNFAAETHVDRSIKDAAVFLDTNIKGVQVLLDVVRESGIGRFVQISTDEVYGDIEKGRFKETFPLKASSPYAASKAAADLLIQSYIRTHKVPAIIIRPCNNYGPWQFPEKLLPRSILCVLRGKKIPVYGRGLQSREWLFVEDCAQAVLRIVEKGESSQIYNVGSGCEQKNIDTVRKLLETLEKPSSGFEFVKDRLGHDVRYCLDSGKVRLRFGWSAPTTFAQGLKKTVEWCLANRAWLLSKEKEVKKLYS
jgi:dTDP-glucose 4,6-dehydratase